MYSVTTVIRNKAGLHARPAAQFVQRAAGFQSDVKIKNNITGKVGNAKSIIMTLGLGASSGTEVEIIADGSDEMEAAQVLASLIDSRFGEQ